MPRQNRVTPFGEIVAVPERGSLMGNRGILHDADERIRRRWASRAWIACLLEFRERRDPVLAPGHYTRLFFLDEPTALAAGHRPCAYCRRADFLAFREAWASGNTHLGLGPAPKASDIDRILHAERLGAGGTKRTYSAHLSDLPDGVIVTLPANANAAYLRWHDALWRWTPGGYPDRLATLPTDPVAVLTPPSIVAALRAGFQVSGPQLQI
jgi:hypothetical protein